MAHEVETMAFVESRGLPWHGLGTPVDGLMTASEALVKAGLDWEVEKRPVLFSTERGTSTVPNQWVSVRTSDEAGLGVTGDAHTLVQNRAAFEWGDNIVADEGAHWETAGSLRGGRVVFMSMEMPKHIRIAGDDGDVVPYLLISNGHDGKRSLEAAVTAVRTVCMNTLTFALAGATRRITLRHASNIDARMAVAAEALGVTYKYMDALKVTADRLAKAKVTEAKAESILRQVFPVPASFDTPDRLDLTDFAKVLKVWRTSDNLDAVRKTGWGVLNAVTEYLDHEVDYRARRWTPGDTKFRALVIGGSPMARKDKALAAVLKATA